MHLQSQLDNHGDCTVSQAYRGNFSDSVAPFDSEKDDRDDEDLSPLEYAQRYGLLTPAGNTFPFPEMDAPLSDSELLADLDGSFWHSSLVPDEKWNLDKEATKFLVHALDLCKEHEFYELQSVVAGFDALKLEEAVLAKDAEMECLALIARNRATVSSNGMRPFKLNSDHDEGFAWPFETLHSVAAFNQSAANERLDVDAEAMHQIKVAVEVGEMEWADMTEFARKQESTSANLPDPMTPPLLPISPVPSQMPSLEPLGTIDFTSSPEDLCAVEIAELELGLLHCETEAIHNVEPFLPEIDSDPLSLPWVAGEAETTPHQQQKPSSFRLDSPLVASDEVDYSRGEIAGSSITAGLQAANIPSETSCEQDLDLFMDQVLEPSAMATNDLIQNEALEAINTTLRTEIPSVDWVEVRPPWKPANQTTTLQSAKGRLAKGDSRWSGVSKIERTLDWTPFPISLAKLQSEELMEEGLLVQNMLMFTFNDDIRIDPFIYKPATMCLLEADDSDAEDLEPVEIDLIGEGRSRSPIVLVPASPKLCSSTVMPPSKTTEAENLPGPRLHVQKLLRKRKLELEDSPRTEAKAKRFFNGNTKTLNGTAGERSTNFGRLTGMNGLSTFMQMQGISVSSGEGRTDGHGGQVSQITQPVTACQSRRRADDKTTAPQEPIWFAEMPSVNAPASIIVTSTFLQNRSLVRQLQKTLPQIDLVERGASTSFQASAGSVDNTEEADITISPATGLIITSLQKLKQKALPGQKAFSGIRNRIASIAIRYGRLIVLISEGCRPSTKTADIAHVLDLSDTTALADLIGFGAHLDSDVEVYHVPGNGDALVQWIAALVARYTTPMEEVRLLHDETLWERFLRSAGLNAYAAQAVLAQMKLPLDRVDGEERSAHGLSAFVGMSAEERGQRFGLWLGGERVLRRVSNVIDSSWNAR